MRLAYDAQAMRGVAIKLTHGDDHKIRDDDASTRLDAADLPELGDAIDRSIWTAEKTVAPVAKQA